MPQSQHDILTAKIREFIRERWTIKARPTGEQAYVEAGITDLSTCFAYFVEAEVKAALAETTKIGDQYCQSKTKSIPMPMTSSRCSRRLVLIRPSSLSRSSC